MKRLSLLFACILTFAFVICMNAYGAEIEGQLNINTADVQHFQMLPGASMEIAQNIVEYRNVNGPFAMVDDLMNVQGMDRDWLDQMRPHLTTSGATTLTIDKKPIM